MQDNFKKEKAINALLYVIHQLNGIADEHKLCKIFYYADQRHLSLYGRSITNDSYFAMKYGPVPSSILDIMDDVRIANRFPEETHSDLTDKFKFEGSFDIRALKEPDMDELSMSDVECLDYAVAFCKDKSFGELTKVSHGEAWCNTPKNRRMSIADILREAGNEEEYIEYILEKIHN